MRVPVVVGVALFEAGPEAREEQGRKEYGESLEEDLAGLYHMNRKAAEGCEGVSRACWISRLRIRCNQRSKDLGNSAY